MRSPTGGRVSQGFISAHQAVDIVDAPRGQAAKSFRAPIAAPISGRVVFVGQKGSGKNDAGLVVEIEGGDQFHRLCHLDQAAVKAGQSVTEGQLVGYMGHTGYTIPSDINGTHLHWIMMVNGRRVDGRKYVSIPASGSTVVEAHRYTYLISRTIQLKPKNGSWRVYKAGTNDVVGDVMKVPGADGAYIVRGVDSKKPNRVLINSAALGQNLSLPLATAAGAEYSGEWNVIK